MAMLRLALQIAHCFKISPTRIFSKYSKKKSLSKANSFKYKDGLNIKTGLKLNKNTNFLVTSSDASNKNFQKFFSRIFYSI